MISFLKNSTQTFKGVLAYDDSQSVQKRKLIREHMFETTLISHAQGELDSFEKERLIIQIKKPYIDDKKMQKLGSTCFRSIAKDCYAGGMLCSAQLREAKEAGVKRILDLYGHTSYEQECREVGLEYTKFPIKERLYIDVDVEERQFTNAMISAIEAVNKGDIYLGCGYGLFGTSDFLSLNDYFNPKLSGKIQIFPNGKSSLDAVSKRTKMNVLRKIYQTLDENDKKRLGFTEEFEKELIKRIFC